jgi:hypothetical protein
VLIVNNKGRGNIWSLSGELHSYNAWTAVEEGGATRTPGHPMVLTIAVLIDKHPHTEVVFY